MGGSAELQSVKQSSRRRSSSRLALRSPTPSRTSSSPSSSSGESPSNSVAVPQPARRRPWWSFGRRGEAGDGSSDGAFAARQAACSQLAAIRTEQAALRAQQDVIARQVSDIQQDVRTLVLLLRGSGAATTPRRPTSASGMETPGYGSLLSIGSDLQIVRAAAKDIRMVTNPSELQIIQADAVVEKSRRLGSRRRASSSRAQMKASHDGNRIEFAL